MELTDIFVALSMMAGSLPIFLVYNLELLIFGSVVLPIMFIAVHTYITKILKRIGWSSVYLFFVSAAVFLVATVHVYIFSKISMVYIFTGVATFLFAQPLFSETVKRIGKELFR